MVVWPQSPLTYRSIMHPVAIPCRILRYPIPSISQPMLLQANHGKSMQIPSFCQRIGLCSILLETQDFVAPKKAGGFLGDVLFYSLLQKHIKPNCQVFGLVKLPDFHQPFTIHPAPPSDWNGFPLSLPHLSARSLPTGDISAGSAKASFRNL